MSQLICLDSDLNQYFQTDLNWSSIQYTVQYQAQDSQQNTKLSSHIPTWLGENTRVTSCRLPGGMLPREGLAQKWAIFSNWNVIGRHLESLMTLQCSSWHWLTVHCPKSNGPPGSTRTSTGTAVPDSAISSDGEVQPSGKCTDDELGKQPNQTDEIHRNINLSRVRYSMVRYEDLTARCIVAAAPCPGASHGKGEGGGSTDDRLPT